jgi:alanyl-tRNA synthetase
MQTQKLYYEDAYLRAFDAQVVARREIDGRPAVALDRTAFYPTGGGQPFDTGRLLATPTPEQSGAESKDAASSQVLDVIADGDLVWHVLDRAQAANSVTGQIDWERRYDHMQQHTGQHILSQAFVEACDAETVSFHLGVEYSTIDLNRASLSPGDIARAESLANDIIDRALPVRAGFVSPEEMAALPLRKPPKVAENIRIVQVEGFDWSACGGTHVAYSSHVQLIKITATERRGSELRITFLCGRRARADYARVLNIAQALSARFTTGQDEIVEAVDRRAAEMDALRKEMGELEKQWCESTASALWAGAEQRGQLRVVSLAVDYGVERAKRVAQALRSRPGTVVFMGVRGDRPQLLFGRSDDVAVDAGALLKVAAAAGGGRGGGRSDWAQGGVPENWAIPTALDAAVDALKQAL